MSNNLLSISNLRKAYGSQVLFEDLSIGLDAGTKLGVIGRNGAGKSTLLRIIAGVEGSDGGTLAMRRGTRVSYVEQVPHFIPGATPRQVLAEPFAELRAAIDGYQQAAAASDPEATELLNSIETLGGWDWESRVAKAAQRLDVGDLDRSMDTMSGGERKRVALARMLLEEAELVMLDEPTNHLDADTIEWLEEWLLATPACCLLVTHDRYFLDLVVTRMAEVEDGGLTLYEGSYTDYLVAKAASEELRTRTLKRRVQLLRVELEWARRSPKARTSKSKARLGRVDDTKREVEDLRREYAAANIAFGQAPRLGKTILELTNLSKRFADGPPLLDDLSLIMRRGERFGVVGPNGCGKTTLLRLIDGQDVPDSGTITVGTNTRVAYFDQHRTALDETVSVREALTPNGGDTVYVGGEPIQAISYLIRFGFPTAMHGQPVSALSGGERNRLAIAKFLLQDANLLLLDEPTNDLDLFTLQVLEEALVSFPGCALIVSHDRFFLDKLATGIIGFERDYGAEGQVTVVQGDYTTYRRLRLERLEAQRAEAAQARSEARKKAAAQQAPAARERRGLTYAEREEFAAIEPSIEAHEVRVAELEVSVAAPDVWAGSGDEGRRLDAELDVARQELKRLYARWEELAARAEA